MVGTATGTVLRLLRKTLLFVDREYVYLRARDIVNVVPLRYLDSDELFSE
jgi:hypothetical protein